VAKKNLCIFLSETYKSAEEIYKSAEEICVSSGEIRKSLKEIHKSPGDLHNGRLALHRAEKKVAGACSKIFQHCDCVPNLACNRQTSEMEVGKGNGNTKARRASDGLLCLQNRVRGHFQTQFENAIVGTWLAMSAAKPTE